MADERILHCRIEGCLHLSRFMTSVNDTGTVFHFETIPLRLFLFPATYMSCILFIHL